MPLPAPGFVFGELGKQQSSFGLIIAFQVLPTIIFISAFFAVLYHLGIMQIVIKAMARLMQVTMRISGAESLSVAASIFMGQTEAPLSIRPFLPGATQSELMTIMTSGMAHVSGGIMAAYILYGIEARHLLAAVIMTSPGTVLISKMLVPETETPATLGRVTMPVDEDHSEENLLGAIARGTIDGGRLAFNVGIMLISFLALIGLLNGMLGGIHNWLGGHHVPFPSSLNVILGFLFAPVAWLIGIPWHSARQVGDLLGTRTVTNELVAYALLGHRSPRSTSAPLPSLRLPCAALPTSAPSGFRLAASEPWRRTGATIWPAWDCARCWRGPWPTLCRRRSWAFCCGNERGGRTIGPRGFRKGGGGRGRNPGAHCGQAARGHCARLRTGFVRGADRAAGLSS